MKQLKNLSPYFSDAFTLSILIFFMLALLLIFGGCSTLSSSVVQALKSDDVYKYDISGEVNGKPFDGVGVIPYSDNYNMKIISKVNVDMLTITSCHRDISVESAIQLGWFDNGRGYTYQFEPGPLENQGSCLVKFGAYNKSTQGQNSWGILDFETPEATLPATNVCNGIVSQTNGVSICQSKAGLIQSLVFPVPVKVAKDKMQVGCEIASTDNVAWEYSISKGECVWAFVEMGGTHRLHRATSVGYSQIQIRGK